MKNNAARNATRNAARRLNRKANAVKASIANATPEQIKAFDAWMKAIFAADNNF